MPDNSSDDTDINRNAPYRSSRRAAQRRGRERRLIVSSELRDKPDVRKVARAIIAMAMEEAEREAGARNVDGKGPGKAADE